jgi:hypothetical protein
VAHFSFISKIALREDKTVDRKRRIYCLDPVTDN